tara:strand:- start:96 stop:236 length:141 start_codon:yes stop_codon:yes gene_type:complete
MIKVKDSVILDTEQEINDAVMAIVQNFVRLPDNEKKAIINALQELM